MESDGLILVAIVANDRFSQHVEGSAKEDVVGCVANDVDLEIELNVAYPERYVTQETFRLVELAVRRLHIEADRWFVC